MLKPRWISAGLPALALICFASTASAADEEFLALKPNQHETSDLVAFMRAL